MTVRVRHCESNRPRAVRSADRRSVGTCHRSAVCRIHNRSINRDPRESHDFRDLSAYDPTGCPLPDHGMIAATMTTHSHRYRAATGHLVRETNPVCRPFRFAGIPADHGDLPTWAFPLPANGTAAANLVMIDINRVVGQWSGPMSGTWPNPARGSRFTERPRPIAVSFGAPIAVEWAPHTATAVHIRRQLCTQVSRQNGPGGIGRTVWAVRSSDGCRARPGTSTRNGGNVDTFVSGPSFFSPVGRIHQPCWK